MKIGKGVMVLALFFILCYADDNLNDGIDLNRTNTEINVSNSMASNTNMTNIEKIKALMALKKKAKESRDEAKESRDEAALAAASQ